MLWKNRRENGPPALSATALRSPTVRRRLADPASGREASRAHQAELDAVVDEMFTRRGPGAHQRRRRRAGRPGALRALRRRAVLLRPAGRADHARQSTALVVDGEIDAAHDRRHPGRRGPPESRSARAGSGVERRLRSPSPRSRCATSWPCATASTSSRSTRSARRVTSSRCSGARARTTWPPSPPRCRSPIDRGPSTTTRAAPPTS